MKKILGSAILAGLVCSFAGALDFEKGCNDKIIVDLMYKYHTTAFVDTPSKDRIEFKNIVEKPIPQKFNYLHEYFDDDEIKYCEYEKYADGEKQVAYSNDDRVFSFYFVKIKSMKNKRFLDSSANLNHYINIPMITFTESKAYSNLLDDYKYYDEEDLWKKPYFLFCLWCWIYIQHQTMTAKT